MIPVFEPQIGQEEIDAVVAALVRGEISGSFGEAIASFEAQFAAYCGVRHGVGAVDTSVGGARLESSRVDGRLTSSGAGILWPR